MILAIALCIVTSQHCEYAVEFDATQLQLLSHGEYTEIYAPGYESSDEVGAPRIPVRRLNIALPSGAQMTDVRILSSDCTDIPGSFLVQYVSAPVILSLKDISKATEPREDIYSSPEPYPPQCVVRAGAGLCDNQSICELLFYPCQYIPARRLVRVFTRVVIDVEYEGGIQLPAHRSTVQKYVVNPEAITVEPQYGRNGNFEYVIISNTMMDTVFQRLADWKTKKGIPAEVRTVNWIYSNYSGEDNPARIRNYLKTLADSSVLYCLLGGDTDVVPCRFAYAMTCSAGIYPGREDTMPADLYYADLQGTWNFDNDGCYGEIEDSIDLYPDLHVGRAPVNTIAEAQRFVQKVLTYEQNPTPAYLDNALLAADVLWSNPYTDQGIHKNQIEEESFPGWYTITKLYRSQNTLTPAAFRNALRQGQSLINHDGHGWIDVMSAGTGYLHNADFDTITNAPYHGVLISIGCWTTAFDFNSIAESYVNSPNGGGVAFIGNTSYGWGSPGNPGWGYSDRFDSRFFYSLLKEDNFHLGQALDGCKMHYIPFSREKNVYRWHQYQMNLLGDPEMPVWTALPETLMVTAPGTIGQGQNHVLVNVRQKSTGAPLANALVCIMKDNETYASGYTDYTGSIFLDVAPTTAGSCDLTVTAHNYLMHSSTIPVVTGAYVNFIGWSFNDSLGNDDGLANPNEDIFIDVWIKNSGTAQSDNIQLIFRSADAYVTIVDSLESLGSLNVNDSVCLSNAFRITVGAGSNDYGIPFELEITDNARTITHEPNITICTPVFSYDELKIIEQPTLPGDTETVYLWVRNSGHGYAHSPAVTLSCSDPYITLLDNSASGADIPPDTLALIGSFTLAVSSSCPSGTLIPLTFDISAETYTYNDDMDLLVGATGFTDDMESGSGLWTTGGTNNLWHISTRRSFSPTHSWYCGNEGSGQYNNNMDCYIQTVPFMINSNSSLRFYRWFHVPLYGTDGIYVIVTGSGFSDTLDFIGTGGALGGRAIQSNWLEEEFPLAAYPAGSTIQLRIAFISNNDGDIGEGFYIDDVNIDHVTFCEEGMDNSVSQLCFNLFPNPFSRGLTIQLGGLMLSQGGVLDIYDASGRLVTHQVCPPITSPDPVALQWNGRDMEENRVPAGVYFICFRSDDQSVVKKAVLLK